MHHLSELEIILFEKQCHLNLMSISNKGDDKVHKNIEGMNSNIIADELESFDNNSVKMENLLRSPNLVLVYFKKETILGTHPYEAFIPGSKGFADRKTSNFRQTCRELSKVTKDMMDKVTSYVRSIYYCIYSDSMESLDHVVCDENLIGGITKDTLFPPFNRKKCYAGLTKKYHTYYEKTQNYRPICKDRDVNRIIPVYMIPFIIKCMFPRNWLSSLNEFKEQYVCCINQTTEKSVSASFMQFCANFQQICTYEEAKDNIFNVGWTSYCTVSGKEDIIVLRTSEINSIDLSIYEEKEVPKKDKHARLHLYTSRVE